MHVGVGICNILGTAWHWTTAPRPSVFTPSPIGLIEDRKLSAWDYVYCTLCDIYQDNLFMMIFELLER